MKLKNSNHHAKSRVQSATQSRVGMVALCLSSALLSNACGKSEDKNSNDQTAIVDSDEAELNSRVDNTEIPVTLNSPPGQLLVVDAFVGLQTSFILPPTVGPYTVQANKVLVNGLTTYIGYNYGGEPYAGAIDTLDLANLASLSLKSSLKFTDTDVNGLALQGSNLYAVGGSSSTSGGILKRIALNGALPTGTITDVALPSYAGTDVATNASTIYATSGDVGGALSVFNLSTLALTKTTPILDPRSVALKPDGLPLVLSGQPGRVNTMTAAGDISGTYAFGGATTVQSKSNLYVGSKWSIATLGEGGFKIFCNADGSVIATVPQVTVSGVPAAKTVTNAVTASGGVIYTANGEGGVYVYYVRSSGLSSSCGSATVTPLGSMNVGGTNISANGVYASGLNVFVADGLGGLRVMTTVITTNILLGNLTDRL
ncbi:MAG: hypothetical protein EOP10_23650 [Proteobacteria bacterium]|nr:MAG: hypothetical protein EOP10_23650 [Pseudomonadota bacterium]